jgi:predicted thioesterase
MQNEIIRAFYFRHFRASRTVVSKRCVATPWCVGRDHEVCREIKKKYLNQD